MTVEDGRQHRHRLSRAPAMASFAALVGTSINQGRLAAVRLGAPKRLNMGASYREGRAVMLGCSSLVTMGSASDRPHAALLCAASSGEQHAAIPKRRARLPKRSTLSSDAKMPESRKKQEATTFLNELAEQGAVVRGAACKEHQSQPQGYGKTR
eukprot:TRINITY_DN14265_c0_g1_i2.p1 TRINITY_DN14265_c0_g1~~TRINITY_DN14265_c0_g1_i2.p1  ORF type:complete len:154 (+),score=21.17 TRINITY_DN14265_c0_g1_i2:153-614(+)